LDVANPIFGFRNQQRSYISEHPVCMKTKLFILLALASLSFAGTKRYDVTFGAPAVLGPMQVESGQYKLSFEGSKVTLVSDAGKTFETTATVQTSEKKFSETVVHSKRVDGKDLVDEIQIGGTKTALDFKP
jgi:hypothetical protein